MIDPFGSPNSFHRSPIEWLLLCLRTRWAVEETPTVVWGTTNGGVTFNPELSKNSRETHAPFGILIMPVYLIRFFRPYGSMATL